MTNALIAGTAIAVATGLVGYFVVLRGQVFTGDALSHVSVTGALAALAFGIDVRLGLFAATIAVGIGIALLGLRGRADDVVIGSVFAWVLGLGVLFLSLYTTSRSTGNGAGGVSVLFGSILAISGDRARVAVAVAVVIAAGRGFDGRVRREIILPCACGLWDRAWDRRHRPWSGVVARSAAHPPSDRAGGARRRGSRIRPPSARWRTDSAKERPDRGP